MSIGALDFPKTHPIGKYEYKHNQGRVADPLSSLTFFEPTNPFRAFGENMVCSQLLKCDDGNVPG